MGYGHNDRCKLQKPSLNVTLTTLSQRTLQNRHYVPVTYLQFQLQVYFLADRAFVLPVNVHG